MRICYIGDAQSVHLQRWATSFAKRGHEVHVITDKPAKIDGATVHPVKLNKEGQSYITRAMNLLIRSHQTKKIVRRIKPDILHAHFLFSYGYWGMKAGHHPFVATAWGSDIIFLEKGSLIERFTKEVIRNADLLHTGDSAGKERLVELGGKPESIFIQIWGVDGARFHPDKRSKAARSEMSGGGDGAVIIMVGGLLKNYDPWPIVKAMPMVVEKHRDARLVIVGEGAEKETMIRMSRELGVEKNIFFRGQVRNEDLPPYYASADIYVETSHPSKGGGGMGAAFVEAMSSGLPAIVPRRPGIRTVFKDGENGFLFIGGDHEDLADKINRLIDDSQMRKRMGAANRSFAEKHGNWESNMAIFDRKYMQLAGK